MNDRTIATPEERVAAFRSRHLINLVEEQDPDLGRIYRCALDGLRVQATRDGRWRHDGGAVTTLLDSVYGGSWGSRKYETAEERRIAAISRIVEMADVDEDAEFDRESQPEFSGQFR